MEKKIPETIAVEISVADLRKEAVVYMKEVFEGTCIPSDIRPSDEELESRFNRNIQDPNFIRHVEYQALTSIYENMLNIFEDYYESDYIRDLIEKSIDISNKKLEQRDADKQKHIKSAMAKLTPEEREALGLKS